MAGHVLGRAAAEAVAVFLRGHLPWEEDGWQDYASTAFQIGCEALVALGQAEARDWGAVPLPAPRLPAVLPRWDDICVAVLWLAEQRGELGWRQMDGTPEPPRQGGLVIRRLNALPPPPASIAGGIGTGPALASAAVLALLGALGLVQDGRWRPEAEAILWRCQPRAWGLQVTVDPRFATAVAQSVATVPGDIAEQMARLVVIRDADIAEAVEQSAAACAAARVKYGPKARIGGPLMPDSARRSLIFLRQGDLDWLFFRHWRLAEGWLAPDDPTRRLEIFHDPLAIQMRQSVVARLHPASPVAG